VATDQTIVAAACIDDAFAMPLLVTLSSACRNLSKGWDLDVFILASQLSEENRQRLQSGLESFPVRLHFRTVDLSPYRGHWPGLGHDDDRPAYYRLFLGTVLPASVERVLYLDADLLIQGNLATLWNLPFDGHVIQAVPDTYAHAVRIPGLSIIEFSEGIRFTADTPYFNSGLQLIDLRRWRQEEVGQRASGFLWDYCDQLAPCDQDALNCTLIGRWKRLPPTWNWQELLDQPDAWQDRWSSADELAEARRAPAVIHFIGCKPWSATWRPMQQKRWWSEAGRAGLPVVRRSFRSSLRERLIWEPLFHLQWHVRHRRWLRIPPLILGRPWTLLTYPLWRAFRRRA
jgi:lipopolysaccharide biosynthesis glycosyltransferase